MNRSKNLIVIICCILIGLFSTQTATAAMSSSQTSLKQLTSLGAKLPQTPQPSPPDETGEKPQENNTKQLGGKTSEKAGEPQTWAEKRMGWALRPILKGATKYALERSKEKSAPAAAAEGAWEAIKTTPEAAGGVIGGDTGAKVASNVADIATGGMGWITDGMLGIVTFPLRALLATVGIAWAHSSAIDFESKGAKTVIDLVNKSTFWAAGTLFVLSLCFTGARMAWKTTRESLHELGRGLLTAATTTSCWFAAITAITIGSSKLAAWIATYADNANIAKSAGMIAAMAGPFGFIVPFIIGLTLITFCIIMLFLISARDGILVLLAAMGPIAGSYASTKTGWEWFQKIIAWVVGWTLYKPVAALIWVAASKFSINEAQGQGIINGPLYAVRPIAMLGLCVFALPAIMKLVVPATASITSGERSPGSIATGAAAGIMGAAAGIGLMALSMKGGSSASGAGGANTAGGVNASGSSGTKTAGGTNTSSNSASGSGEKTPGGTNTPGTTGAKTAGGTNSNQAGSSQPGAASGAVSGAASGAVAGPVGAVAGAALGASSGMAGTVQKAGDQATVASESATGSTNDDTSGAYTAKGADT